jgi:hypothetical protein
MWTEVMKMSKQEIVLAIDQVHKHDDELDNEGLKIQEPSKPYVLEMIKDVLMQMDYKPSAKNSLLVYNLLINNKKLKK